MLVPSPLSKHKNFKIMEKMSCCDISYKIRSKTGMQFTVCSYQQSLFGLPVSVKGGEL